MFSPCTSDTDHKACFPFFNVVRDQKTDHILQFVREGFRRITGHHIIEHFIVKACQRTQFIHIIGIGKKSHIKHKICICRDSILKAEGKHRDHDIAELSVIHKDLFDFLAKLPGKQMAGINDIIRTFPEKFCFLTFQADSLIHSPCSCQRVASSGFFIAFYKDRILCIHKQDLVIIPGLLHTVQNYFQFIKGTSASGIDPQSHISNIFALHLRKKGSKFFQKLDWKIIHAEISHILQHFKCSCFSCS